MSDLKSFMLIAVVLIVGLLFVCAVTCFLTFLLNKMVESLGFEDSIVGLAMGIITGVPGSLIIAVPVAVNVLNMCGVC